MGGAGTGVRWRRLVPAAAAALAVGLSGCASGQLPTGDRAAAKRLTELQASLDDEAEAHFQRVDDPVELARWATNDSGRDDYGDGQSFTRTVEALSWGSTDGLDGLVDLRLRVTTPGFDSSSIGSSSYGPGSAERCVRFHVGAGDDPVTTIDCAGRAAVAVPPRPTPSPGSAEATRLDPAKLRAAMRSSSLASAERAAAKAFPALSVTSATVDGSWVVVVVRGGDEPACMGGTKSPGGQVVVAQAPRVRPGEDDCNPDRFVHGPVYGH
ncbi:hypothetical protein [Microlunatus flavus]|uniref:hypothetical protein n=1 Tax=Microlunatus flavus TaxID=1036181 RepID=UPI001113880F|nr:hypothetical protein [Microlunatus flavus]